MANSVLETFMKIGFILEEDLYNALKLFVISLLQCHETAYLAAIVLMKEFLASNHPF